MGGGRPGRASCPACGVAWHEHTATGCTARVQGRSGRGSGPAAFTQPFLLYKLIVHESNVVGCGGIGKGSRGAPLVGRARAGHGSGGALPPRNPAPPGLAAQGVTHGSASCLPAAFATCVCPCDAMLMPRCTACCAVARDPALPVHPAYLALHLHLPMHQPSAATTLLRCPRVPLPAAAPCTPCLLLADVPLAPALALPLPASASVPMSDMPAIAALPCF